MKPKTKPSERFGSLLSGRLWLVAAMLGIFSAGLASCSTESLVTDTSFSLYYSGISEICPGTNININPTWHGTKPVDFAIVDIRFNARPAVASCFSVDSESGVFSINGSDDLPTGVWTVGIECRSDGRMYVYEDAISINMMKPVPDGIFLSPSEMTVKLSDITGQGAELPCAEITTDGNRHVQIKKYLISNVYRNGDLHNECKEWFELNPSTGVFSIVPQNPAFEAGVYTFDFRLTTYAAGGEDEEGLFGKALRLDVTSAPVGISYNPSAATVEIGYSGKSVRPEIKGSLEGLVYTLKSVSPDNSIGITVDDATGVIKFPETYDVSNGDKYTVSITAENKFGAMDFNDVFTFNVTDFIFPLSLLEYDDIDEVITGVSFEIPVKDIIGDEVTFAFDNLPEILSGLEIDPATGTISCAKGIELPVGRHTVTVLARNVKSECRSDVSINVVANPYMFTYVIWGNNLGLTPAEEYGNQFRISEGDPDLVIPVADSDIPDGVPVKFTFSNKTTGSSYQMGASVAKDGTITIVAQTKGKAAVRTYFGVITVTVGGESEAAVTRNFPLFVDQAGYRDGYSVQYTPFAFRVNPKTGGTSVAPVVKKEDGAAFSGFTMDYRRNFYFYRLGGPEQHKEGKLAADTFLYSPWYKYYSALKKPVNTGANSPMSYYGDANGERGYLGLCAAYVNPGDLKLVVNADRFVDDYGYGDGVVIGTMQYNVNNNNPVTSGAEIFPIIIWLDPNYTR